MPRPPIFHLRELLLERAGLYRGPAGARESLVEQTLACVPDRPEFDFLGDIEEELFKLMHQLATLDGADLRSHRPPAERPPSADHNHP